MDDRAQGPRPNLPRHKIHHELPLLRTRQRPLSELFWKPQEIAASLCQGLPRQAQHRLHNGETRAPAVLERIRYIPSSVGGGGGGAKMSVILAVR